VGAASAFAVLYGSTFHCSPALPCRLKPGGWSRLGDSNPEAAQGKGSARTARGYRFTITTANHGAKFNTMIKSLYVPRN